MNENLAPKLFALSPLIRYVAVNQSGQITEMTQSESHPSHNDHETDRAEELLVNPVMLELAGRRGNLDLDGVRYIVIRYGPQFQLLFPYQSGHLSVGVQLEADVTALAKQIASALGLPCD